MDSSTGGGDNVDRISGLSADGLLQVILSFVRQVPAVTARDLSLEDTDLRNNAAPGHFAGFVDWVLARRGDADMDSLRITMMYRERCPSLDKINQWIRYGMQRVVGDFHLCIPSMGKDQAAVELPSYGKAASISLDLSCVGLRLPAMARYEELTELTLYSVSFREDEQGRALGDFLSCSCPRLRRLDMRSPRRLTQLVLRVEALEELRISLAFGLALDVTAPNLLVLKLKVASDVRIAKMIAPRLQEIRMLINPCDPQDLHGLTSIRSLGVIQLDMHAQYHHKEDDSFWLLRNCPGVEDVKVSLCFLHDGGGRTKDHVVDAMMEGAETFPNVRSMRVKADFTRADEDHLVASMASLLIRFPRLSSLCIEFTGPKRDLLRAKCFCDALGKWTDHGQISMEFLEEVKISGFTGASEELDLVSLLFKISSRSVIKSMTLSAASKTRYARYLKQKMEDEDEDGDDSLEPIHLKLMDMSSTNSGHWHFRKNVCTWVC
ncbi:unnamed protein product [Urochloa decumbens]|uniref:At1g61320/AtMIF1 LRR domain-containing protein n=1 Tax=Urochloa decumbens TaxID=240449 RepID=A0ABC8ZIX1_9POAL